MNYWLYKLTTDIGGAPCASRALLSLAICKPHIRMRAKKGDIVLGFVSKSLSKKLGGRIRQYALIYIAQITRILPNGEYYRNPPYHSRPDCIYEWNDGRLRWRSGSKFHLQQPINMKHDVGMWIGGSYDRSAVLLSTSFVYFGRKCSVIDKKEYPNLENRVSTLPRDYVSTIDWKVKRDLVRLSRQLLRSHGGHIRGKPCQELKDRVKCLVRCD